MELTFLCIGQRRKKRSIYVWAAGDGGHTKDFAALMAMPLASS